MSKREKKLEKIELDTKGLSKNNWQASFLLILYLPFFLINKPSIVLLIASILYILAFLYVSYVTRFKKIYDIHPSDNSLFQFLCFSFIVVSYGALYYMIFLYKPESFIAQNKDLSYFDFIYFSIVTITTLGYGDIFPNNFIAKTIVIFEILSGIWFLVAVLPTAIAIQTDKLLKYHQIKMKEHKETMKRHKKLFEELQKMSEQQDNKVD